MTVVNAQRITDAGLQPVFAAAVATTEINPETDLIYIKNGSGGAITATAETPGTVEGLAISDLVINVPAGQDKIAGPFSAKNFKQPSTGKVKITFSATSSVTVAVLTY